jgi:hypothetical protein
LESTLTLTGEFAMRRRYRLVVSILALAALGPFAIAGCGDDDDPARPEESHSQPLPGTADSLMLMFKEVYAAMDIDAYAHLLDQEFLFKYRQEDVENLGLPYDRHDRSGELACTENMFSGEPASTSGEAGISGIEWSLLQPVSNWEDSTDDDFPGASRRLYNIILRFLRPAGTNLDIQGQQIFYVAHTDTVLSDSTVRSRYRLVGQVDMTGGYRSNEEASSWGSVKALYGD